MNDLPFKFDEIGIWSELKLEIVEQYGAAYTKAFARNRLKKIISRDLAVPVCMSPRRPKHRSKAARRVL